MWVQGLSNECIVFQNSLCMLCVPFFGEEIMSAVRTMIKFGLLVY